MSGSFSDWIICAMKFRRIRKGDKHGYDYRDAGRSSGPVPMGHVESGLEQLAAMNGNFEVTITRII